MRYLILLIVLSLFACKSESNSDNTQKTETKIGKSENPDSENNAERRKQVQVENVISKPKNPVLVDTFRYALVNKLNVRKEPKQDAKILFQLAESYAVIPTGNISDHSTTISIRGKTLTDRWYEVKLKNDPITGWVHGSLIGKTKEEFFPSFDKTISQDVKAKKYKERVFGDYNLEGKDNNKLIEVSYSEESEEWAYWDHGNLEEYYHVFSDDNDNLVLFVTSPVSESGDWFEYTEYYYDTDGQIRVYHFHESSFNSNCSEARTDTWLYLDASGKLINKLQQESTFDGKIIPGYACFYGEADVDKILKELPSPKELMKKYNLSEKF